MKEQGFTQLHRDILDGLTRALAELNKLDRPEMRFGSLQEPSAAPFGADLLAAKRAIVVAIRALCTTEASGLPQTTLSIKIEVADGGPQLTSKYGDNFDASYRTAHDLEDLKKMAIEVIEEWSEEKKAFTKPAAARSTA